MARLVGVELQDKWKIDYALTRLKGIGWPLAKKVLDVLKMDNSRRISSLTNDDIASLTAALEQYPVEGDLARKIRGDIKRLQTINSYRGGRHSKGLPARGQRTRSNARTKRGKRKTVGAFKKEVLAKMTAGKEKEK